MRKRKPSLTLSLNIKFQVTMVFSSLVGLDLSLIFDIKPHMPYLNWSWRRGMPSFSPLCCRDGSITVFLHIVSPESNFLCDDVNLTIKLSSNHSCSHFSFRSPSIPHSATSGYLGHLQCSEYPLHNVIYVSLDLVLEY